MKRRNSFAPHLPKPALLPLLVLLALPPCTSQAGFLQEFYDDAGLQSSYTAPGLYASASMDTVTGGRFILKANREDFQPYYLQGPELKAGCGGIDVFLGAFSIPSKDEFVSFVRSIGTALPGLAFHAALQSLAPDLNEQISQFRDMLMRYASMLGDSCQVAENIMNAGPNEWISSLGHKARNSLRSLGQAEDAHDADSLTRADGGKVVSSAPTRTDTGGNIVDASELNLTWALLISGKGSQRLTQEKREVMMSLIGTRVFVKKGSGTSTTIEERNYPALDLLNAVLGEPGSDKIPTEAVVYKCDEKDKLTEDAMRYPIVIERGDDTHAYGVVVPDLPGCFSAGDTLDEAYVMAKEAVEGWLECAIDDGEAIPEPSSMESVAKIDEYQGWILGTVDVDLSKLSDKSERVNITLPKRVLHRLDGLATRNGDTRSGYIAHLVLSAS